MTTEPQTAWAQPTPVMDVDIAFPARALEIMPSFEECEEGLKTLPLEVAKKWLTFQMVWFRGGLPVETEIAVKDGIDAVEAMRHLSVIQGSFAPKHQHKEAAVAYLASRWFEDVDYGKDKAS